VSLIALCAAYLIVAKSRIAQAPWGFALIALVATVAWLTFVASATVGYLTPLFTKAVVSTIHTVTGESAPRQLFGSTAGGPQAPVLERAVGIGSVVLMVVGFPFGLRALWRRYRNDPLALVFALAAAAFFGTLALRFAPAAWEVGNRASEFLFLGLAFVLALVGLERWSPGRAPWAGRALAAACLAVVFSGGVIAGWKPKLRLAQPYRIKAGSHVIDSEGRWMARWAATRLGPDRRFAASDSDARLLAAYAGAYVVSDWRVLDLLQSATLGPPELSVLHSQRLRYVVVDRRLKSFDNTIGYFFGLRPGAGVPDRLFAPEVALKFDGVRADRLYDSGNIVLYDTGGNR
jgi:hypothetical protein